MHLPVQEMRASLTTSNLHPSRPARAMVTGGAGFIGSHLVGTLMREGIEVLAVDNERSGRWSRVPSGVACEHRDLAACSESDFTAMCREVDVVFHLAAEKYNSSLATPDRIVAVNVDATMRLFRGAAQADVGSIVFTSSLYAYGSLGPTAMRESDVPTPNTLYGMSKVAGEHMLRSVERDFGVPWSAARLFFIYGPNQHAEGGYKSVILRNFERLREGESPVVNGDGTQSLDYVYVADAVDALMRMAKSPGGSGVVNVASGQSVSVTQLTELMLEVSGSSLAPIAGPADWTAGTHRFGAPERASQLLGWAATTPLDDGLRAVWERPEVIADAS